MSSKNSWIHLCLKLPPESTDPSCSPFKQWWYAKFSDTSRYVPPGNPAGRFQQGTASGKLSSNAARPRRPSTKKICDSGHVLTPCDVMPVSSHQKQGV